MKSFIGSVSLYNQHGEGVVFIDKKPFYIYGAIVGEEVEFEVVNELETYGIGKLKKIIKRSRNRVDHEIDNAHLIGGYDLIHMNDDEQKNFKINKVKNDFKQIAKYELKNVEWIEGKLKTKYRNKITLHDGYFYQKNSNTKIDIDDFLLSDIKWDKNLKGDVIYRQLDTLIVGSKKDRNLYTSDTINNFKFRVGINSFYQVNKEVAELAYNFIKDNLIRDKNTLDLYCGIGTISIIVSEVSKYVLGIEINRNSYRDALHNKELNKINNVDFLNIDVNQFMNKEKRNFENVILDPSREGVDKKTLTFIRDKLKPERIIYMSCNTGTQAANFNYLKDEYEIKRFVVLDMFPQTYHIESIMVLDKK